MIDRQLTGPLFYGGLCLAVVCFPVLPIYFYLRWRNNNMKNQYFILSWYYNGELMSNQDATPVDYKFYQMLDTHPDITGISILAGSPNKEVIEKLLEV